MKKLITLVLALAMVLSLAACGGSKDGSTEGTKKSDYPKYAITVVTSKSGSAVDNNCRALTQYLGEKLGVNIVVSNASGQNEALREVMNADKDGYTALHYAIDAGSLPIAKMLIASGADPLAKSKEGDTAIERAVMRPEEAILAYLLDDIKVNGKNLQPTQRAIDWCVIHSKVIPLTTLVAHGAKVTDRHLAAAVVTDCLDNVLDMVKYLVELGCDVNAKEVHDAVSHAHAHTHCGKVHDEILAYLKANGYRDEDGTPRFAK